MKLQLLALTTVVLLGCNSTPEPLEAPTKILFRLHFDSLGKGHSSVVSDKKTILVRSYDELVEMWSLTKFDGGSSPKNWRPPYMPDFSKEAVVTTFMGAQMTGGYSTEITGLWMNSKNELEVQIVETHPHPDRVLLQFISHPYQVVKIGGCCLEALKRLDGTNPLLKTEVKVRPIEVKVYKGAR